MSTEAAFEFSKRRQKGLCSRKHFTVVSLLSHSGKAFTASVSVGKPFRHQSHTQTAFLQGLQSVIDSMTCLRGKMSRLTPDLFNKENLGVGSRNLCLTTLLVNLAFMFELGNCRQEWIVQKR